MSGIRLAVTNEHATGLGPERLGHVRRDDHAAERQVAARDALGEGHEIGLDAEPLEAEPGTEPAEAADHGVADEQDVRVTADPGDLLQVSLRRRQHAAGADDRLGEEGGDPLGPDRSISSFSA